MAPNPLSFITACLPCFPTAVVKKANAPGSHRAEYYNSALRANLGMPERPLRLPVLTESQQQKDQQNDQQQQCAAETSNDSTDDRNEPPSLAPARRTAPQGRGRFPTTSSAAAAGASNRKNANPKWSNTPMETAQLEEFFEKLSTLEHLPYAICGRGALVDHGLSARKAKQVSILVPAHSKDVVASWAKSSGWVVQRHEKAGASGNANGVFVGVPLASDGSLRQLRVKYLDDESFEQLERVRSRLSRGAAWVLSLASQLDHLAAAWLDFYRQSKTTATPASKKSKVNHDKSLREIARDITWTLNAMSVPTSSSSKKDSKGKGKAVTGNSSKPDILRLLPTLQSEDFFVPFTNQYEEARTEMARAGIDVSAVLVSIRERRALREHNAMLAQYGAAPLLRARAAGGGGGGGDGDDEDELPFNRIRDLNHSKSVYTLATNISVSELGPRSPRSPVSTAAAAATAPLAPSVPAIVLRQPPAPAAARLRQERGRDEKRDEGADEPEEARARPRSTRVNGGRPGLLATSAAAAASAPDLLKTKKSSERGLRRSESTRAPPRRSEIPPAAPGRKSLDWI